MHWFLGEQIASFVVTGSRFGVRVRIFARDGENPLGTAGAIRRPCPLEGIFFVLYGDSYLTCTLLRWRKHSHLRQAGLMTVYANTVSLIAALLSSARQNPRLR